MTSPGKELYSDDRRVWNGIYEMFSANLASAESEGVDFGGATGRVYPVVLANKGDWSYLASGQNKSTRAVAVDAVSRPCPKHYICSANLMLSASKVSSANLERSFRRAPKGKGDKDFDQEGAGICHQCMAGLSFDWENLSLGIDLHELKSSLADRCFVFRSFVYIGEYKLNRATARPGRLQRRAWLLHMRKSCRPHGCVKLP